MDERTESIILQTELGDDSFDDLAVGELDIRTSGIYHEFTGQAAGQLIFI